MSFVSAPQILLLSNNAVRTFPSEVLIGCTELFTLSLHGNQITIDQLRQVRGGGRGVVLHWERDRPLVARAHVLRRLKAASAS